VCREYYSFILSGDNHASSLHWRANGTSRRDFKRISVVHKNSRDWAPESSGDSPGLGEAVFPHPFDIVQLDRSRYLFVPNEISGESLWTYLRLDFY
jgi:hypothetical protein